MPSKQHQKMLSGSELLLGGGWRRSGFRAAACAALIRDDVEITQREFTFIPDAFRVKEQEKEIEIIEVGNIEDRTHDYLFLDDEMWELVFYHCDTKSGVVTKLHTPFTFEGAKFIGIAQAVNSEYSRERRLSEERERHKNIRYIHDNERYHKFCEICGEEKKRLNFDRYGRPRKARLEGSYEEN